MVFETGADAHHDAFFRKLGVSHEQQVQDHKDHLDASMLASHGRGATPEELEDTDVMLGKRGISPVSESLKSWMAGSTGSKSNA